MQLEYHDHMELKLRSLVETARKRSKTKRKLDATWIDTVKRQRLCALTSLPFDVTSPIIDAVTSPLSPSIDRIDRRKGYTPDNVRVVTHFANIARNVWSDAELKLMIIAAAHTLSR